MFVFFWLVVLVRELSIYVTKPPEIILICNNLHKWAPMAPDMFALWVWGKQELVFD